MGKFTERKRLRLARMVMARSALREHRSVLIALDALFTFTCTAPTFIRFLTYVIRSPTDVH